MHPVGRSEALSRGHFHSVLREWYETAYHGEVVGDAAGSRRAWVWVRHQGSRWHLDADTTHEGVGEYLELLDAYGEGLAWSVAARSAGSGGNVVFGPERRRIDGFRLHCAGPP